MNIFAKFILFVFIVFLSTPTIVSLIENDKKLSFFYVLSQDDDVDFCSKMKIDSIVDSFFLVGDSFTGATELFSTLIFSENLSKHESVTAIIFITPPDRIYS
jgi:hypothetical protein